jgi:hypothetical protein
MVLLVLTHAEKKDSPGRNASTLSGDKPQAIPPTPHTQKRCGSSGRLCESR